MKTVYPHICSNNYIVAGFSVLNSNIFLEVSAYILDYSYINYKKLVFTSLHFFAAII